MPNDDLGSLYDYQYRYAANPESQREAHERLLQQQEQQRRQYDSETQRMGQDKKYGVLSGLIGKMGGRGYGMGGYGPQIGQAVHPAITYPNPSNY